MDTDHIGIVAGDRLMFRPFSTLRELDVVNQPFQIALDFSKGLFIDMAFHHKLRLLCAAVIYRFDAQPQKLRISLFEVYNFRFFRADFQT